MKVASWEHSYEWKNGQVKIKIKWDLNGKLCLDRPPNDFGTHRKI